jgi:hypothetical protein
MRQESRITIKPSGQNKARDKLIIRLAIYEGFRLKRLFLFPVDLSAKGVANISRLKQVPRESFGENDAESRVWGKDLSFLSYTL